MKLYSYYRSSAAYRVRIALNLKGVDYQLIPVNLLLAEHQQQAYRSINPQGLVPALELDNGKVITQSPAILEWLECVYPNVRLLPEDPFFAAQVRSVSNIIACDIHPVNNLRVLAYLENELSVVGEEKKRWYQHWIHQGFTAIESMIEEKFYCFGESPTFADAYLVPQVFNALRFEVDLDAYPRIKRVYEHCSKKPAFIRAQPEKQPDAT